MFDIDGYIARNFEDAIPYGNPQTDWSINCIKCDDTKHHMNVSIDKSAVHCWKCGYSTSWVGFVMDNSQLPYHKAIAELYKVPSMKTYIKVVNALAIKPAAPSVFDVSLPEDYQELHTADDSYELYKRYLVNRGFGEDVWRKYGLGVAPSILGRIIIPIERGYWQGRAVLKWLSPKYLNPKIPARDIIFNSDALVLYDEVVICEGAFSAMAVGNNALALIGKEIPEEKLARLISAEVSHYIIALEENAWVTISRLAEALFRNGKRVTIWRFSKGDPADKDHKFDVLDYNLKTRVMLDMNYQV